MGLPPKRRKIVVIGGRAVGKSTLTSRFTDDLFYDAYYPTVSNYFTKTIEWNGQLFETEITDTEGYDEYSIIPNGLLIGRRGYILVYSVGSRESFELVPVLRDKLFHYSGADQISMVIVGNKSDLGGSLRQVQRQDGEKLAAELQCPFTEASAKTGTNVIHSFELIIGELEEMSKSSEPTTQSKQDCIIL